MFNVFSSISLTNCNSTVFEVVRLYFLLPVCTTIFGIIRQKIKLHCTVVEFNKKKGQQQALDMGDKFSGEFDVMVMSAEDFLADKFTYKSLKISFF